MSLKRISLFLGFFFLFVVAKVVYDFVPLVHAPLNSQDLLKMNPDGHVPVVTLKDYFFIKDQYARGQKVEKLRF